MRAVSLEHVAFEGPGAFAPALAARGVSLDRYLVPRDGLPRDAFDVLIVMGGPMSANDPEPWIAEETQFIRSAIARGQPVLGVCLGSQLMAKALGATVRAGRAPEIGMTTLTRTPEAKGDPFFGGLPESFEVFEWHGEVFDLPEGCVPLASSDVAPVQAFRSGARAYGVLFHLELDDRGIEALCRECATDLAGAGVTAYDIHAAALPSLAQLHRMADRLIGRLLDPAC